MRLPSSFHTHTQQGHMRIKRKKKLINPSQSGDTPLLPALERQRHELKIIFGYVRDQHGCIRSGLKYESTRGWKSEDLKQPGLPSKAWLKKGRGLRVWLSGLSLVSVQGHHGIQSAGQTRKCDGYNVCSSLEGHQLKNHPAIFNMSFAVVTSTDVTTENWSWP